MIKLESMIIANPLKVFSFETKNGLRNLYLYEISCDGVKDSFLELETVVSDNCVERVSEIVSVDCSNTLSWVDVIVWFALNSIESFNSFPGGAYSSTFCLHPV